MVESRQYARQSARSVSRVTIGNGLLVALASSVVYSPRGYAMEFQCYYCGGTAHRVLKQADTVECLKWGRRRAVSEQAASPANPPAPASATLRATAGCVRPRCRTSRR